MSSIGEALTSATPPVRAIFVYNANPGGGGAAFRRGGARLRARGPLLRRSRPVPDRHRRLRRPAAAGDVAARAPRRPPLVRPPARAGKPAVDRSAGRGAAEYRALPPARRADGLRRPALPRRRRDAGTPGAALRRGSARRRDLGRGQGTRIRAAVGAGPVGAVRRRRLPDRRPAGASSFRRRSRPRVTIRCRRSCRRASRPGRIRSWRDAFRSRSCRRRRATSSIRRSPTCPVSSPRRRRRGSISRPTDAAARGIADGDRVRIFNDRGSFTATARLNGRARTGVVVCPSIWWRKLSPDGRNANAVTGQALTDLGRAATFYDCLVEVARCG